MENNNNIDAIQERLNRIQNQIKEKEEREDEKFEDEGDQNNANVDLNKLKNKVKMDNAPELKEVKELDRNMQKIKNEFAEANNSNISKERFGNYINSANEMFKNYEKQLQYYSIYAGKYNVKDLTVCLCTDITALNERSFYILSDKKRVFENELNQMNLDENNPDLEEVKKLYQEKIDTLFKENKNLNKVIEKMTNQVVANFQLKINDLYTENKKIKELNGELEEKVMKVKFIFAENSRFNEKMKEKESEIIALNKQQILYMNKFEKASQDIKKLNETIKINRENVLEKERKFNEKCIELKKMEGILEERENTIKEKILKITEQENQIKLLFNDNVLWEKKFNDKVKENENFKKWAMWDTDLVESFKKIEKLTEDLGDTKKNLENTNEENIKFKETNQKLSEELDNTKRSENKLKKENTELNIIKNKYIELEQQLKDYLQIKRENENYKKELSQTKKDFENKIAGDKHNYELETNKLKRENESKINDLKTQHNSSLNTIKENYEKKINKLNEEIQNLKEEINNLKEEMDKKEKINDDLNTQLDKKTEILSNLRKSYDDLTEKIKVQQEKLQGYEKNDKKNKSVFDEDDENEANDKGKNVTDVKKIISSFDQFSFTKEVLNDYLYCLYLFETTISIQSLVSNIMGNLNLYSTYSFKTSKLNSLSNYPLNSVQNEFLEDIYFVAFDKFISKKILFNKDQVLINGVLDKKILKANFEDFDPGTIAEICLELINKNIITKLKSPKTLEQLSQIFNSKYTKKFDFEGENLNDFLNKQVVPIVQKRISRYNKHIIDEMKTLVELSLHNLHDGKIIIDGEEVYNFEKFFEQYNNYKNVSERNIKIEMETAIFNSSEGVDNIKHTLKYYYPQIIRMDKSFTNTNDNSNNPNSYITKLAYMNKVLAAINYYQPKISQLSFINNKLDRIFNNTILSCIKLIKTLTMLDLSNNELNEENIKELCEYLKQNKTIKILYLNNNNLSSACGYYLADTFKKNSTIEIFHYSHNNLNESGFDSFLNILGNDNTSLVDLDISYNQFKFLDFKSLSGYLNSNPPLKKLDISGNNLEPQAANIIGVAFKKLTNLEELKLNNCGINDESIQQLFNFLNESSIQNLEIDSNKLETMGPMILFKKIQVCKNLKYLSYQNMTILNYLVDMIIQTLNANSSIERINLKQNNIKEDELKKFADAAGNLKNVKFLFSKDKIPSNAIEIIGGNKNILLQ
jgi:hypothetical protein